MAAGTLVQVGPVRKLVGIVAVVLPPFPPVPEGQEFDAKNASAIRARWTCGSFLDSGRMVFDLAVEVDADPDEVNGQEYSLRREKTGEGLPVQAGVRQKFGTSQTIAPGETVNVEAHPENQGIFFFVPEDSENPYPGDDLELEGEFLAPGTRWRAKQPPGVIVPPIPIRPRFGFQFFTPFNVWVHCTERDDKRNLDNLIKAIIRATIRVLSVITIAAGVVLLAVVMAFSVVALLALRAALVAARAGQVSNVALRARQAEVAMQKARAVRQAAENAELQAIAARYTQPAAQAIQQVVRVAR